MLAVNAAAARILERTREGASVAEMAQEIAVPNEQIFAVCEQFRRRGILDVTRSMHGSDRAPSVTVIIPTRDRAGDLGQCLGALARLDYPRDQFEVIVVDDGSADPEAVASVTARHSARLLVNGSNRGPSHSRNRAAGEANGEILAFVDSDCVAGPSWLRELTPYFAWESVGAVGGRTIGYFTDTLLDRYEEVASPLDMGPYLILSAEGTDTFYVPTCNFLVRRSLYETLDGLREDLRVGEDVDFCWRLRASGAYLIYTPEGTVRHRHRGRLGAMLRRRAEYGTSEATLHSLHRDKQKRFPLAPAPLATAVAFSVAVIGRKPRLLPLCLMPPLVDGVRRFLRLRRNGVGVPVERVCYSVLRGHLSLLYFIYFHLVRYYLLPLSGVSLFVPGVRRLILVAALYSSALDYSAKRPRMGFLAYLAFYTAEHSAYQLGVIAGSIRAGTFRSYLPTVQRNRLCAVSLPAQNLPRR